MERVNINELIILSFNLEDDNDLGLGAAALEDVYRCFPLIFLYILVPSRQEAVSCSCLQIQSSDVKMWGFSGRFCSCTERLVSVISKQISGRLSAMDIWDDYTIRKCESHWICKYVDHVCGFWSDGGMTLSLCVYEPDRGTHLSSFTSCSIFTSASTPPTSFWFFLLCSAAAWRCFRVHKCHLSGSVPSLLPSISSCLGCSVPSLFTAVCFCRVYVTRPFIMFNKHKDI